MVKQVPSELSNALAALDENQADVLEAMLWWSRGFAAAHRSERGYSIEQMPWLLALRDLPETIRKLSRLKETKS